jgi:signal transduction histidine kinase/streptogramin lyase
VRRTRAAKRVFVRASLALTASFLLILALARVAAAEPETPPGRLPFRTYGAEVGFGSWAVHAITQGTDGSLWVGTDGELYRYDGERLAAVDLPGGSHFVTHLAPAPDGGLWCLTTTGTFFRQGGRVTPVALPPSATGIRGLVTGPDGRAWMASTGGLLQETAPGRMELVPGFSFGAVDAVAVDGNGGVIALGPNALAWQRTDGSWQSWGAEAGLAPEQYLRVGRDGAGRIWFVSPHQLWRLRPETNVIEPIRFASEGIRFEDLAVDREGAVWIGAVRGLYRVGVDEDEPVEVHSVPGARASSVFEDREGSLWVGGIGLHRVASRGLLRVYDRNEGLPNQMVWRMHRDAAGRLYAATSRGLARAVAGRWETVPEVGPVPLVSMVPAEDGSLWLGGNLPEVLRFTPATGRVERFALGMPPSVTPTVYTLVFDTAGALWAATQAGVYRGTFDPSPRFARVPLPGVEGPVVVTDARVDRKGRLWLASSHGLYLRDGEAFRRFTEEDGLRIQSVLSIAEFRQGELCVVYPGIAGASCFREADGALHDPVHYDESSGLPRSAVYLAGADLAGRLWIGTGRGLAVISDRRVMDTFTVEDGLPGDDVNAWSFLAEPDGDVWIGTSSGLTRFLGARYQGPPPPPSVFLASARGGGRDLSAATGPIELEESASDLSLEVFVPAYVNEMRVEVEARLVGTDDTFRKESARRIRYQGLRAGSYRFEARARYRPGEFGPIVALSFVVLPPFWQRWWVRGLGVLGLLGAGGLVVHLRQRQLRRRNAELSALVEQRTRALRAAQARLVALEREATEQQMAGGFAHEIRNALVGARMLLSRADGSTGDGKTLCEENAQMLKEMYLDLRDELPKERRIWLANRMKQMNANEAILDETLRTTGIHLGRAFGLTRQLLEYAQLGRERPGGESVPARALIEGIVASLREEFAAGGIEVETRVPEGAALVGKEAHHHSIVDNLVRNARDALLDRKGEGPRRLLIELMEGASGWVLRVEDTGIGMAAEHRERIFEPFFSTKPNTGTGLGLGVVRKLVGLYGGTIGVESEVGRGTVFVIELPRGERGSVDG